MAKIKVEVLGAYVDGNAPGSTIEIDERSAKHFESIGYVRVIKAEKKTESTSDEKGTSAPKKSEAKPKSKSSQKSNKK